MRALTPLEARVLGVLVEKQHTVPDTYPLSLNALVAGCNQKTARDPVIAASDAEIMTAVDGLKAPEPGVRGQQQPRREVRAQPAARAEPAGAAPAALLTVLMLRGPQTSAELRMNADRLHRFEDIAAVEALPAGHGRQGAGAGAQAGACGR